MLSQIVIPEAVPAKKVKGYQMPETKDRLVSSDFFSGEMAQASFYWISTVYPDRRPHVVPVWGIWHENRFYFDGSIQTAWGQNILKNPAVAVHLPSPEKVVILEGTARIIQDDALDAAEWAILDRAFQSKYQVEKSSPYIYVEPKKALAWDGADLKTMTRWLFNV
jgi:general stress protein 26